VKRTKEKTVAHKRSSR